MKVPEIKASVSTDLEHIKCCLCCWMRRKKDKDDSDSDFSNEKKVIKNSFNQNIIVYIKKKTNDFMRSIS